MFSTSTNKPTSAKFQEGLLSVPLKIRSSISLPLNCLADTSPRPNLIASTIFDLPQPLGPTIPVSPGFISNSVGSTNDLKPLIESLFKESKLLIQFFFNNLNKLRSGTITSNFLTIN